VDLAFDLVTPLLNTVTDLLLQMDPLLTAVLRLPTYPLPKVVTVTTRLAITRDLRCHLNNLLTGTLNNNSSNLLLLLLVQRKRNLVNGDSAEERTKRRKKRLVTSCFKEHRLRVNTTSDKEVLLLKILILNMEERHREEVEITEREVVNIKNNSSRTRKTKKLRESNSK